MLLSQQKTRLERRVFPYGPEDQMAPAIRKMAATVRIAYNSGKGGQNQRLAHHVVAVADCSDAVGADLGLIIRRRQADQTRQQSRTENGRTLQQGHRLRQEALDDEVAHEAVKALRSRIAERIM